MRRIDPKVIERWYAIRPMLWCGKMVSPGDLVPPGPCDMAGKVIAREVLGCKKGQCVKLNPSNGQWEVVDGPPGQSQCDPPIASSAQPIDAVPMPKPAKGPALVSTVDSEQEPAPAPEAAPEQELGPVEPLFGRKPSSRIKKARTKKARTKKAKA